MEYTEKLLAEAKARKEKFYPAQKADLIAIRRNLELINENKLLDKTIAEKTAALEALESRIWQTQKKLAALREWAKDTKSIGHLARIKKCVCDFYEISALNLESTQRNVRFVLPRHVFCYIALQCTGNSSPQVGKAVGNRDHTTILHARDKIQQARKDNPAINEQVVTLLSVLGFSDPEAPHDVG